MKCQLMTANDEIIEFIAIMKCVIEKFIIFFENEEQRN